MYSWKILGSIPLSFSVTLASVKLRQIKTRLKEKQAHCIISGFPLELAMWSECQKIHLV